MSELIKTSGVFYMDCLHGFPHIADESVDLAFADPPFNIGYNYGDGEYKDNLEDCKYHKWCKEWISAIYAKLKPHGTFWLAIGDEQAAELKVLANSVGFHLRSWVIWYYTFGVNSSKKFSRSHVHLLYFTKHKKDFTFNEDAVRVPSSRAIVYNDKRANPRGRLPDDTWIIRPQALKDGFAADSDVWSIPRVCGTYNERIDGAANQMPEQLLARIIRACSNEGDLVLDPMAGTGTTLAVAKKLNRRYVGFEQSDKYALIAAERVHGVSAGEVLDGPLS